MAFWGKDHTGNASINDPKRNFRFIVQIDNLNVPATEGASADTSVMWFAKSVTKPGFAIANTEHKYLNHTFYYPGSVTWNDVTITFVDPQNPDASSLFSRIVETAGYKVPSNAVNTGDLATISKAKMGTALGGVTVAQLDANGNRIEEWKLWNPIITDVKYGELSYGNDELVELSVTFKYDWAALTTKTTSDETDEAADGSEFFSPSNEN
jgi:hypothetical protein